ncbi:MAG: carboxypeptidase-like regulatory domain-containing protein, partial [Crocinitomicaceae bacterium]|nr:carboxypeptidase-like regulatory domain-containing protein [Crocinitomicaceae bacterium]
MFLFLTRIYTPVAIFAGIILVFFSIGSYSQSSQTVRGSVIDRDSKLPLIGAKVVIMNTDPLFGCTSDLDGNFRIENVPVGRHIIRVTYTGYEELVLHEI